MKPVHTFLVAMLLLACAVAYAQDTDPWPIARKRAEQANEAFVRCHRLVYAWYEKKAPGSYLLPQNLKRRLWNGHNAAADLWSFFVISTYLTDEKAHNTFIRQTLRDDIRLASRVGCLPDDYDIDKNCFVREEINLDRILFSASEYAKDGLLPIVELTGRTVYFQRGCDLLNDIFANAPLETKHGKIPGGDAEVNGEMLQNLSRYYGATGNPKYKEWAERIGDAYFLDALPKCNDLPCHSWDFAAGKPAKDRLSLSDHGNEIIFGLSELVMMEHVHDPEKAKQYLPVMRRMIDKLLAIARNEHGLWVRSIQPSTGKVTSKSTPDTWGYALDAVYALYMITGEEKYRDAVHRAMRGINADERYTKWGGSDAFADAIESGIVLYNRIREPECLAWIEKCVPVFLAKQRDDGIIEAWHGDGNYARTALMYALMKTAGTRLSNWRADVKFGGVADGDTLRVLLTSDKPWTGNLHLDYPRHRIHFGLQINYPRLNEYPEWYVVEPTRLYKVTVNGKEQPPLLGDDLMRGLPIEIKGEPVRVVVTPLPGPPYGGKTLLIKAPPSFGGSSAFSIPITIQNNTGEAQTVRLQTSFGKITPTDSALAADGKIEATLTGELTESTDADIEVTTATGASFPRRIHLVHGKNMTGFIAFDEESYQNRGYQWCGRKPIQFTLPAKPGRPHKLHLLWGSKGRNRTALVTINGHAHHLAQGGYDGFQWLILDLPADQITTDRLTITIAPDPKGGKAAFVAEAKLTTQ